MYAYFCSPKSSRFFFWVQKTVMSFCNYTNACIFCIYLMSEESNLTKPLVINAQDQLMRKLSAIHMYMYKIVCGALFCFILHRYFNPSQMCFEYQSCIKTLPKTQRTQGLSVLTKVIAFNSYCKFINLDQNSASKSWQNFSFKILTKSKPQSQSPKIHLKILTRYELQYRD